MIFAHGFDKIAQKYSAIRENMHIGQLEHITWPGHFGISVIRHSEDKFELTVFNGTQNDVNQLMASIRKVLGYDTD
jgi:hypothetical protein